MAYSIVKLVARRSDARPWQSLDPATVWVSDTYAEYVEGWLTLRDAAQALHHIALSALPAMPGYQVPWTVFVTHADVASWALQPGAAPSSAAHVHYSDASAARYQLSPAHPLYPDASQLAFEDLSALRVTRAGVDYATLRRSVLFTAAGLAHLSDTDGSQGVLLYDAAHTLRRSGRYEVGMLDFSGVGALQYLPLQAAMLGKRHPAQRYAQGVHVELGQDLAGTTPLLVLGGMVHWPDEDHVQVVGAQTLQVAVQRLPLLARYHATRQALDLNHALQLETPLHNPSAVNAAQFYSDAVLARYFTLSQSFVLCVHAEALQVRRHALARSKLLGHHDCAQRPRWPLLQAPGWLPNYLPTQGRRGWGVNVLPAYSAAALYRRSQDPQMPWRADGVMPPQPSSPAPLQWLELGTGLGLDA